MELIFRKTLMWTEIAQAYMRSESESKAIGISRDSYSFVSLSDLAIFHIAWIISRTMYSGISLVASSGLGLSSR